MRELIQQLEDLKDFIFDKVKMNELDFEECNTDGDTFSCSIKDPNGNDEICKISIDLTAVQK